MGISWSAHGESNNHAPGAARRILFGVNVLTALALAAILLVMVNYLGCRHYQRWDVSREGFYRLSEKTLQLLASVTGDVSVVVFFQPSHDLYEDVRNLLKEYAYHCPRLRIEWVDPDRDLARTEELASKYRVSQANVVVFDADGRTKYVNDNDMVELDLMPLSRGQTPRIAAFRGEQAFSSALQSVTQERRPVVYFLQGHGERDPEDFSRVNGYSQIVRKIREDNMEVRVLNLGSAGRVPDDCDVLIIAGPRKEIPPAELDALRAYLDRKGNLLFLHDALTRCGLEPVLRNDWGVELSDDVVVDGTRTLTGRELFVPEYSPHAITIPLKKVSTVFYLPRSVEPVELVAGENPAQPKPVRLAACSVSGWAETDPSQSPMKFDPGVDRPGPVGIAVAVEKGGPARLDLDIRPARLVVVGDSDFAANGGMTGGNADFFLNALNWLAERETLLAIEPRPVREIRLIMTRGQLRGLFWAVVAGLPGLVALAGLAVWWQRRS